MLVAPPAHTLSDTALVAEVRAGDERAFEVLYTRYLVRVRGFVGRRLAGSDRVEDITQEVFLSALRRLRTTAAPIALEPWLFAIARNACIDEYRRRSHGAHEVTLPDELAELPGAERLPAPAEPPAEAELHLTVSALRGAFRGLSAHHHELIVLRELEGLSYDDIARRLGVSRPAVESSLFRARRKLGHEYAELISGRRCASVQALAGSGEPAVRRLGLRERRIFARHLDHCRTCRRAAWDSGLDANWLRRNRIADRVAALLPIGWLRGRFGGAAMPLPDAAGMAHAGSRAVAAAAALAAAVGGNALLPPPDLGLRAHPAASAAVSSVPASAHVAAPGLMSHGTANAAPAAPRAPHRLPAAPAAHGALQLGTTHTVTRVAVGPPVAAPQAAPAPVGQGASPAHHEPPASSTATGQSTLSPASDQAGVAARLIGATLGQAQNAVAAAGAAANQGVAAVTHGAVPAPDHRVLPGAATASQADSSATASH